MEKKSISDISVFRIATYVANIMLLNILFLLCSIPIVTIGVSYTSMCAVARKLSTKDVLVFKTFFKAFKENIKQCSLVWLIILLPILLLTIEYSLLSQVSSEVPLFVYVTILIPSLFIAVYFTWVFIQPAYFELTLKQQFKNAFLFMLRLIPQDVVILVLNIFPFLTFIFDLKTFLLAWPVWLFMYNATCCWLIIKAVDIPLKKLGENRLQK